MNLVEILKNVPKGIKLYSSVCGELSFVKISNDNIFPIVCTNEHNIYTFTKEGKYVNVLSGECVLFPSKENRDWNTFKVEKPSYKFKPFDKVLVRRSEITHWICNYFSHMCENYYVCLGGEIWTYCIPYNDETKHLVGTSKAFV